MCRDQVGKRILDASDLDELLLRIGDQDLGFGIRDSESM